MRKYLEAYNTLTLFFKIRKLSQEGTNIIKEVHGHRMYLDLTDAGLSRELISSGTREPFHTELIQKILKGGEVVYDIGANMGYYVFLEARAVGERGRVYAIEPVPANIEILKKNTRLNRYENIEIFELAIGDKDGCDYIYMAAKKNWSTMASHRNKKGNMRATEKIPVKVRKLDTFIQDKKFPDLIRMDVEGYETEIIKGMHGLLASRRPLKLFMELHCSIIPNAGLGLLKNLEDYGFAIKYFFRERPPLMLGRSGLTRDIYYFLGRKINGVYEFVLRDVNTGDLSKIYSVIKEETFHVYLERK